LVPSERSALAPADAPGCEGLRFEVWGLRFEAYSLGFGRA